MLVHPGGCRHRGGVRRWCPRRRSVVHLLLQRHVLMVGVAEVEVERTLHAQLVLDDLVNVAFEAARQGLNIDVQIVQ